MAHTHDHSHNSVGNLKVAFFLNLVFTLLEIAGGLWTNSIAIIADAVHDLGDSASLGMAWYLEHYSHKDMDNRYSFGYRRFSLLGALLNATVLIFGGIFVLTEAIPRLMNPQSTYAPGMIGFAIVGVLVNGAAVLRLRGSTGLNARVVAWHLLEDVLGWAAVLIVSVALLFTDWYILDSLLSIGITLYVLYNAIRNLWTTLTIFLQATPEQIDLEKIKHQLGAITQVQSTHHTHIWSLDGEHHVLTTHLVVGAHTTKQEIMQVKKQAKALAEDLHLEHMTVEVEYEDEQCFMRNGPR